MRKARVITGRGNGHYYDIGDIVLIDTESYMSRAYALKTKNNYSPTYWQILLSKDYEFIQEPINLNTKLI